MEGQLDGETRNQDKTGRETEPAEDAWKSWQRGQVRNTLHLVSAAAQWILLLACLIYLGINSLQPSTTTFVIVGSSLLSSIPGKTIKGVAVNLTAEVGSIQMRNGSIMIPHDGLYLVSLKGAILFTDLEEEDLLMLWKTDKTTSEVLWK
ncbi:hypothetical protein N306_01407, partial [Opisthocomus hoazin]